MAIEEKISNYLGENKKIETNNAGFVKFKNRDFSYKGDKSTWAKLSDDGSKLIISKAKKGIISRKYEEEITEFAKKYGVDFEDMDFGERVEVDL